MMASVVPTTILQIMPMIAASAVVQSDWRSSHRSVANVTSTALGGGIMNFGTWAIRTYASSAAATTMKTAMRRKDFG